MHSLDVNSSLLNLKVKKFISSTGTPLSLASKILHFESSQFLEWWVNDGKIPISFAHLNKLSVYFNISPNDIISEQYDINSIRKIFINSDITLPEKYMVDQKSYVRTSAHIIKYLVKTRGQFFCDTILCKLGVNPYIYENLSNKINLLYFIDLLDIISLNGVSENELDQLACSLFLALHDTDLGQALKSATTYYECYSVLIKNIHLFDSNFKYGFILDTESVTIVSKLIFLEHQSVRLDKIDLTRLLRYRQILSGCIPYLSSLAPILPTVHTIKSTDAITSEYYIKFN